MKRTKEEAEQTRCAVLQSALDTFCEKGYSKTTFDEIARRINLTKGAVYWHFRNKTDIIAALINEYMEEHYTQMEKLVPELRDFDDILNFFIYSAEQILSSENNRKITFFLTCRMEWSEAVIAKVQPQVENRKKYGFNKIMQALNCLYETDQIDRNVDIEKITHVLLCAWNGILTSYFKKMCQNDIKDMITETFNLIFKGLKKEGTENASH